MIVRKPRSETRQLTAQIAVRFTPADLCDLRKEADRQGISVQQLLRDSCLRSLEAAPHRRGNGRSSRLARVGAADTDRPITSVAV
ncbi:MAG: hypothetical protein JO045_07020 [Mycobacterium sp.]|nr:hypothetical protein [Mycobacterium sp.]